MNELATLAATTQPQHYNNHRMSALNSAQYCAKSPDLSGKVASDIARMSSAFHRRAAKAPDWQNRIAMLSDAEETEINTWKLPDPVEVAPGVVLRYEDAEKELELGLAEDGSYVPFASFDAVTKGHLDFAWVVEVGEMRVAYVPDIKRSEWTLLEGPEAPQVHAYGMSYASKTWADAYVPGIWSATEGVYWWGEMVVIDSDRGRRIRDRIVAIAKNLPDAENQYTTGAHCTGCYGRMRCPAYLLPPEYASTTLKPLVEGAGTPEELLNLIILAKRAEETAELAKKHVQEAVRRGTRVFDAGSNMVYGKISCKGRETLDKLALETALKEAGFELGLDMFMKRGASYDMFKWVKP